MMATKTYGDFIDAVKNDIGKNGRISAEIFLEEWEKMSSKKDWKEHRKLPLNSGLVREFIQDMHTLFVDRISRIFTEELYTETIQEGHDFLDAVYYIATEKFRVQNISPDEAKAPFTISEVLERVNV